MIASVTAVAGRTVEFSAVGRSGIRSSFSCVLTGTKPPKKDDAGVLEIGAGGRTVRFVSNHKFYDFDQPRCQGSHLYQGMAASGREDIFVSRELGLVRFGKRLVPDRAPIPGSIGELVEKAGIGFEFRFEDEPPFDYAT